jgi:hypothetical protein
VKDFNYVVTEDIYTKINEIAEKTAAFSDFLFMKTHSKIHKRLCTILNGLRYKVY